MSSTKKAIVLFSGGLDSTTVLAIAKSRGYDLFCLSFDYGQKHKSELIAAKSIALKFKVKQHKIIKINADSFDGSALTDKNISVPNFKQSNDIPVTYVPARNTIFLSFALAFAETIVANDIFIGVNAVDYSGYPDCRLQYIKAFEVMANLAIKDCNIIINTPLIKLTKAEIIAIGLKLKVDYSHTISCYRANDNGMACGKCDACYYRKQGFIDAGVKDNTKYF